MNHTGSVFQPIIESVNNLRHPILSPYIHCSKINGLLQIVKTIPSHLETVDQKIKSKNGIQSVCTTIQQFKDLATHCQRDTCIQFLLSTPIKYVKRKIRSIRKLFVSSFESLGLPAIGSLFKISKSELKSQDLVDLKRIFNILLQISEKNREDAAEKLAQRFKSLKKLGIKGDMKDKSVITIPELPSNLQMLIKHEDVTLGKEIGKGVSGSVYLGTYNGMEVAVKVLHHRSLTPIEMESFRREIYALSVLSHPNLLKFYGYSEEPFYLLTEYMPNGSLFKALRKKECPLTPTMKSLIAIDIARGVEYLHGKGFIHRDLKSLNILLDKNYRAKICDFGMVRIKNEGPATGLVGTAHWMAPEVLMSSPTYNQKVDSYSFGILLWELLTGEMPYYGMNPVQFISTVIDGQRPQLPDDTPIKLRELIVKCWDQDPAKRPTFTNIIQALADSKAHFTGTDEAVFATSAGIISHHKATSSQFVGHNRRGRTREQDSIDLTNILSSNQFQGKHQKAESKDSNINIMFQRINDNSDFSGEICPFITVNLNQRTSETDLILTNLLKCKIPNVFDVNVLKALLNYSTEQDDNLRIKALSVLIVASNLRFDFLASSPSFLVQLLSFLAKPVEPYLVHSFFVLIKKLIGSINVLPNELLPYLFSAKAVLNENLRDSIIPCIAISLRFPSALKQLTLENFTDLFENFEKSKQILIEYINPDESIQNDKVFIDVAIKFLNNSDVAMFFGTFASKDRFAFLISEHIPLNTSDYSASMVYRALFINQNVTDKISQTKEFYQILLYFINQNEYHVVSTVLNQCKINASLLSKTKICSVISKSFNKSLSRDDQISLMGSIYAISKVMHVKEFDSTVSKIFSLLFNSDITYRIPSFLAISVLCEETNNNIDISKFVPIAALYINNESKIVRVAAANVIKKFIFNTTIDLEQFFLIFVHNFQPSEELNSVIDLLMSVIRGSDSISQEIQKQMSQIYSRLKFK